LANYPYNVAFLTTHSDYS